MLKRFFCACWLFVVVLFVSKGYALQVASMDSGGSLYISTSSKPGNLETVGSSVIEEWIKDSSNYWALVTVNVDIQKTYTVTLEYPTDGTNRSIGFASPDGENYSSISFQVKTEQQAKLWGCSRYMSRWNISFAPGSTAKQLVIYYTASEPNISARLTVEEARLSDEAISAKQPMPTCTEAPDLYWGGVVEDLLLTGDNFILDGGTNAGGGHTNNVAEETTRTVNQKVDETFIAGINGQCGLVTIDSRRPVDFRLAFQADEGDLYVLMDVYCLLELGGTWFAVDDSGELVEGIMPLISGYLQSSHLELFNDSSMDFSELAGYTFSIYIGYILQEGAFPVAKYDCRTFVVK